MGDVLSLGTCAVGTWGCLFSNVWGIWGIWGRNPVLRGSEEGTAGVPVLDSARSSCLKGCRLPERQIYLPQPDP